ncbi:MAG: hypothetical protein M3N12_05020 [Verrucomicrobiota bacterium]|nr:hypothetical protein [Verrucomicrobiota bacterium]
MILTLDDKRRRTVPASLAPARPGDHFKAEFDADEDTIVFRRVARSGDWLEVLKSCQVLQAWLTRLIAALHGRILGFNVTAAQVWADQEHVLKSAGLSMPVEDSFIAAIARRHNLVIATGNEKDFRPPGLKVFNPFKPPA